MTEEATDASAAILAAAAAQLRHGTFEDISYSELAEQTSVSERTIYRRSPTRSHLLEALGRWLEDERFALPDCASLEEFRDAVRARFRAFDAAPAYAFVAARAGALSPTATEDASPTVAGIRALVERAMPGLNPRDQLRLVANVRYFVSPMFWARMRSGFEMSGDQVSEAFEFALQRVLPGVMSRAA